MKKVKEYIATRYNGLLDYSKYHCSCAGIEDEAVDVLNEVLCSLFEKDPADMNTLLNQKKGDYTHLDFYILRMIKLNVTSPTSPYQHKYRSVQIDNNVDYSTIEIEDECEDERDVPQEILDKIHIVREVLDEIMLSEKAREIFDYRFFHGEVFANWPGPEEDKELYEVYNKIVELIKDKLSGNTLF